jgi:tRNA A37 threonylcarbamoyladenosine synthetase subunit TsaC/SUA5/YrdC
MIKYTVITEDMDKIIDFLNHGEVVAIPTDGVFGLFCKKDSILGQKKIFEIKNRDLSKKLCIYTKNLEFLSKKDQLIGMTYIYKNIGFRAAQIHPKLNYIIEKTGDLLGTSCNLSGEIPITHYKHIKFDIPIVKDFCSLGLESTIFSLDEKKIFRKGAAQMENFPILENKTNYKISLKNAHIFSEFSCLDLAKYFWFLVEEYRSLNFNISCFCYSCSLISSYLKILKKNIA